MLRVALTRLLVAGCVLLPGWAFADSPRCVGAAIVAGAATPGERAMIEQRWRGIGGPNASGSSGPLGCPLGAPMELSPDHVGRYIGQEFQRGWILIGRAPPPPPTFPPGSGQISIPDRAGVQVVLIRSLGQWWAWWKGFAPNTGEPFPARAILPPDSSPPGLAAAWAEGGYLRSAPLAGLGDPAPVTLYTCAVSPHGNPPPASYSGEIYIPGYRCQRLTPTLNVRGKPLDFAATLARKEMFTPHVEGFAARRDAAFPRWLPCYVGTPGSVGEDGVALASVMMYGHEPCPWGGPTPRDKAIAWLSTLDFGERLPGTDTDKSPCVRLGDLDVAIAGLLRIMARWKVELGGTQPHITGTPYGSMLAKLSPWGGPAREGPFIEPDEIDDSDLWDCLGYPGVESENHILLQEADRYLINRWMVEHGGLGASVSEYDNATNGTTDMLRRYLELIARRDYYEFNSLPYTRFSIKALGLLSDHAESDLANDARGLLHWTFAKHAIASNLDRDIRPFRRQPNEKRYNRTEWFGDSTTATTAQSVLLVGAPQHVSPIDSFDLTTDDGVNSPGTQTDDGADAFVDPTAYAALGSASETFLADFTDIRDTTYQMPAALRGWAQARFTDTALDWQTYVQVFHHHENAPIDSSLFLQPNAGIEIYSGNRNWTIAAGGTAVGPGMPPDPEGGGFWILAGAAAGAASGAGIGFLIGGPAGAAIGGAVGFIGGLLTGLFGSDAIAESKQRNLLWGDQAAITQPTTLIPTPLGLDRTQTLRFGAPFQPTEAAPSVQPRLCVAEGFMCGFDLVMPSRPFPDNVLETCRLASIALPPHLETLRKDNKLGCPVMPVTEAGGQWRIWTYDSAEIALNYADPADKQRWFAAYVIDNVDAPGDRQVKVDFHIPGSEHDWYNVYAYTKETHETIGRPPDGYSQHRLSGNPDDPGKTHDGTVSFPIEAAVEPAYWIVHEACDPDWEVFDWANKDCNADKLPALRVNIAPKPKQPFACKVRSSDVDPRHGFAMQVGGDCANTDYGLYVYVWQTGCGPQSQCPEGARSYGIAIISPSSGWSFEDFLTFAQQPANQLPPSGGNITMEVRSVRVPRAPSPGFGDQAPYHEVTFRWVLPNGDAHAILSDTGAGGALLTALGSDTKTWPLAAGHVTAPDGSKQGELISATGNGCFTVVGPQLGADPPAFAVDLRKSTGQIVEGARGQVVNACQ